MTGSEDEAIDQGVDVESNGANVGARTTEQRVPTSVGVSIGLDGGTTETNGDPSGNFDHHSGHRHRLRPTFVFAIQMPLTAPTQRGLENDPVVEPDDDSSTIEIDRFDDTSFGWMRTDVERSVESGDGPTTERGAHRSHDAIDTVPS